MSITDVAGLEALPVGTIVRLATGRAAEIRNHDIHGLALCATNGMVQPLRRAFAFLPAEVLFPRTVTPEQVETNVRQGLGDIGQSSLFVMGPAPAFRAGYLAALAAMGIEVQGE